MSSRSCIWFSITGQGIRHRFARRSSWYTLIYPVHLWSLVVYSQLRNGSTQLVWTSQENLIESFARFFSIVFQKQSEQWTSSLLFYQLLFRLFLLYLSVPKDLLRLRLLRTNFIESLLSAEIVLPPKCIAKWRRVDKAECWYWLVTHTKIRIGLDVRSGTIRSRAT